jgi:hypothetical protein
LIRLSAGVVQNVDSVAVEDRDDTQDPCLKGRKDQNINGLMLQMFPILSLKIMGLLAFY